MADHLTPEDQLREDRGAYYGPVRENHVAIGLIWGGILAQAVTGGRWQPGQPVPPEIVCLCMAGVKASREAYRHKPGDENVLDACNYWRFAGELSK